MRAIFTLFMAAIMAAAFAYQFELVQPAAWVQDGSSVDYGTVGPGQTFQVKINPAVKTSEGEFIGQYDSASVMAMPSGWASRPSSGYANPMIVEVTVDPNAQDGDYTLALKVEDEGGKENIGGAQTFNLLLHVRHDVLKMQVEPKTIEVGAGQPARFAITLSNSGSAPDQFSVTSSGVSGWARQKNVYLAPGQSKTVYYEVVGNDESSYKLAVHSRSASSSLISQEDEVSLVVRTNLISDMKATSHGILLFPILQVPMYSLAGILGLLFP